jgi:hypothetical protein
MHAVLWSMSYEEEEDACMSYEEEDACMSYEEEDACNAVEHLLAHVFYGFLSLLLSQDAFDGDCALEGRPASWGGVGGGWGGGRGRRGIMRTKAQAAQADELLHACVHAGSARQWTRMRGRA